MARPNAAQILQKLKKDHGTEIGNYGVTGADVESRGIQVAGFVIRDESPVASNWRADGTLRDYLAAQLVRDAAIQHDEVCLGRQRDALVLQTAAIQEQGRAAVR